MLNDHREWPSPGVLATALLAYALVSLAFSWPLPLHLGDRALGPVGGDLGVYVWNLWVFRHEAAAGHSPLFTSAIFSLGAPTDLSLHNYTLFANLLAAPLLPVLGVVTTYNVLCLANLALGAFTMFLLAWHVTRQAADRLAGRPRLRLFADARGSLDGPRQPVGGGSASAVRPGLASPRCHAVSMVGRGGGRDAGLGGHL